MDFQRKITLKNALLRSWNQIGSISLRLNIIDLMQHQPSTLRNSGGHNRYYDGLGEYETMTVSLGKGNQIEKLYSMELPDSVGLFYSAFTAYLGFEVNEGEYKVMGMAGFGEPVFYENQKII